MISISEINDGAVQLNKDVTNFKMLTATFRKIQSISDGNFHGCYASNKAEKFKFRRLSQGIESCAHAQALKLRKEEKEIVKQLKLLEREKEKHENEKKEKEIYSRLLRNSMDSENTDYSNTTSLGLDSMTSLRRSSGSIKSDARSFTLPSRNRRSGNRLRKTKSYKSQDFEEVVPFYMQHSYSCYHDNTYNDVLNKKQSASVEEIQPTEQEPSWKIPTKLSRLKTHRKSINDEISEITSLTRLKLANLNDNHEGEDNSETSPVLVEDTPSQMFPKERRGSKQLDLQPSAVMEAPKPVRNGRRNSVLTPMERNELVRHQRTVRSNSMAVDCDRRTRQLFQQKHAQRRNTYHGPGTGNCYMKKIIKNKMARQLTLEDVLHDEFIDDWIEHYDEGRVYPAYRENVELTFDDFRALRKCKYLRLSDMNWESLKQATLESLGLI